MLLPLRGVGLALCEVGLTPKLLARPHQTLQSVHGILDPRLRCLIRSWVEVVARSQATAALTSVKISGACWGLTPFALVSPTFGRSTADRRLELPLPPTWRRPEKSLPSSRKLRDRASFSFNSDLQRKHTRPIATHEVGYTLSLASTIATRWDRTALRIRGPLLEVKTGPPRTS